MRLIHHAALPIFVLGFPLPAQQVKFIDLTTTTQRVELRHPPAPPTENGYGGGYGGISIGDCGLDARDPRSLTVSLQSVIAREEDSKRPFEIEFKVLNTGKVPLQLPVSAHLSDLQPPDESVPFTYMSLALSVSPVEDRSSIGSVELYGKAEAPGTLVTLNPGEWIRIEAKPEFLLSLPPAGTIHLVPGYWMRRATFHPHPGGSSTAADGICVKADPTPPVVVQRN